MIVYPPIFNLGLKFFKTDLLNDYYESSIMLGVENII